MLEPDAGDRIEWGSAERRIGHLPFDHDEIIGTAIESMRTRLWSDTGLTRALTGETFPTTTASMIAEQLTGVKPRPSSLHREPSGNHHLQRLDAATSAQRGRPAITWKWTN
ncbi:hypothetical protein [Homoserinimonas hongtaonis]|uniref:hypothetical protein n=1 Tax=Homoserinimonas hongtaonis TaxID=2079791 RepID=UPI000D35DACE|nr:hypothetical protein [Salinibacterium hongtaonis]AWB88990.1 hypothetical protein C2138_05035 [Salinibacterium hongtaonis]